MDDFSHQFLAKTIIAEPGHGSLNDPTDFPQSAVMLFASPETNVDDGFFEGRPWLSSSMV